MSQNMEPSINLFFTSKDGHPVLSKVRVQHANLCDQMGSPTPIRITDGLSNPTTGSGIYSVILVFLEYSLHRARFLSTVPQQIPSLELVGTTGTLAALVCNILRQSPIWLSTFGYIPHATAGTSSFLRRVIETSKRRDQFIIRLRRSDTGYEFIAPHNIFVNLDRRPIFKDTVALDYLINSLTPAAFQRWQRNIFTITDAPKNRNSQHSLVSSFHQSANAPYRKPPLSYEPDDNIRKITALEPARDRKSKALILHLLKLAQEDGLSVRNVEKTIHDMVVRGPLDMHSRIGRDKIANLLRELEQERLVVSNGKIGKLAAWIHANYRGSTPLPNSDSDT
jgi:hypothetical protein